MELETLFNLVELDWENSYREPDAGEILDREYDINPEEFLEFAESDIQTNDRRGLVNALSNSKRAIDCQVDKMLECFGINAKKWNLRNFPAKLDFLKDMGVVAPRIIQKIITTRNYLEHDYKCPKEETVANAIDIAHLFIEASNRKLNIWDEFFIRDAEYNTPRYMERGLKVLFHEYGQEFKLMGFKRQEEGECIITPSNKTMYFTLLKLAISNNNKIDEKTIQYFINLSTNK